MENYIIFNCGCTLGESLINDVSLKIIGVLKKELPEEAQNYEIYNHILKNSIRNIESIPFKS